MYHMNKPMSSSTMEAQSPAMKMKKRGSWDFLAGMAADMVSSLEIGDGFDNAPSGCSSKGMQQTNSLPAINNRYSSMPVPTKGGGTRRRSAGDGYDPNAVDLRSQAKQQKPARSTFSSLALPTARKKQTKKDPLMEFHERRNKAENEYKKQEMSKKRQQQLRDHDEEKSLSSSNSFFDFLVRSAPDDLTGDETSERDDHGGVGVGGATTTTISNGGGMKRTESTHSMASFFGLFGDNEEEIAKLSSIKPASNTEKEEDPHLQAAVTQSKSVKGHRVFAKGKQAADKGDWKKAVAYYHIALVKQREYYGEDHLIASSTLNSLGLALMNLGEHFGALTALQEALHIRQEALGAGAEEVAETTSNIWMVLKASQDDGHT